MMLPADMALITDETFRKYSELYAKDEDASLQTLHRLSANSWH